MSKRALIAVGFAVLFFLHQDFWWKDDPALVLGVLPVSLAYHVVWTLLVAGGWLLVAKVAWPDGLEETSRCEMPATTEGIEGTSSRSPSSPERPSR